MRLVDPTGLTRNSLMACLALRAPKQASGAERGRGGGRGRGTGGRKGGPKKSGPKP